jgi:class 3 adenylate cyclase
MGTTTFLFVDQVGSTEQLTRLGDQEAQRLRRALFDTLRQATEVAGGHEVDFTGDGLFCAFEGAADAVEAAVAMQQLVVSFNGRRRSRITWRSGSG